MEQGYIIKNGDAFVYLTQRPGETIRFKDTYYLCYATIFSNQDLRDYEQTIKNNGWKVFKIELVGVNL